MTRCLILGGSGFIGSHLAEALLKNGYSVTVFDNFRFGTANLKSIAKDIAMINGEFLNESEIASAIKGVDYLFHYVSTTVPATAFKDPVYDIQSNLVGSVRLLQLAVKNNVKKVIFPSSGGTVYGEPVTVPVKETDSLNPLDPYGISKLAIEKYLNHFNRAYGLEYLVLRYSNPYGERQNPHGQQGVIPVFLNKIKMGERPVIYGDGSAERDYIYVGDAVEATIATLETRTNHRVFNVGSGHGTTLNELVTVMEDVSGRKISPIYVEDSAVRVHKIVLDVSRIYEQNEWKPTTSLRDGIMRTWNWIVRQ
jgi:UDP-glucose 4-epimerase